MPEFLMLKKLPNILAIVGGGATAISILVAILVDTYSLHQVFFQYDYMWLDLALRLLLVGIPMTLIGTIWWARKLEPKTRIKAAVVLFAICGSIIFLPRMNIQGGGSVLWLALLPVVVLSVILFVIGFATRASK